MLGYGRIAHHCRLCRELSHLFRFAGATRLHFIAFALIGHFAAPNDTGRALFCSAESHEQVQSKRPHLASRHRGGLLYHYLFARCTACCTRCCGAADPRVDSTEKTVTIRVLSSMNMLATLERTKGITELFSLNLAPDETGCVLFVVVVPSSPVCAWCGR
jgi:hypothetical protein